MILPTAYSQKEVEEFCLFTLEGQIIHTYASYIPGVEPPMKGNHWILETPKIVSTGCLGKGVALLSGLADAGFWTIAGTANMRARDRIRVSVVPHVNSLGFLTLMPTPVSTFNLVHAASLEPVGHVSIQSGEHAMDLAPFHEAWIYGVFAPDSWSDHNAFGALQSVWNQAWPNSPAVLLSLNGCTLNPCAIIPTANRRHSVYWRDGLPPITPFSEFPAEVRNGPLAVTIGGDEGGEVLFNRRYPFTAGNNTPDGDHYDLVTVAAHEMGHCLGIGHLNSSPNNLMFENVSKGEQRRTLTGPDIDAVTNIYG